MAADNREVELFVRAERGCRLLLHVGVVWGVRFIIGEVDRIVIVLSPRFACSHIFCWNPWNCARWKELGHIVMAAPPSRLSGVSLLSTFSLLSTCASSLLNLM